MPSKASNSRKMASNSRKTVSNTMKMVLRTPIRRRDTRQSVSNRAFQLASEWVDELNYYNFSDKWRINGKMPIFYKLINIFLLLIQFNQLRDRDFFSQAVKDILSYYNSNLGEHEQDKRIDSENIIEALLENIIILYDRLQLFPSGEKLLTTDLLLYHGIHYDSIIHRSLLQLNKGDTYKLPIFMSTSVTRDVACRFTDYSKIIIRIAVNQEYLRYFKYVYFGDTLIISDTNFFTENEFLLNLFSELRFISKTSEEITYREPYVGDTYRTITNTFSIFDMEFVRHSTSTPEQVKTILEQHIANYRNQAHGGKKNTRNTRKNKNKNKNKRNTRNTRNKRIKRNKNKNKNKRKILNKNRNILTKSRKLYKNGRHYTRKNLRTQ